MGPNTTFATPIVNWHGCGATELTAFVSSAASPFLFSPPWRTSDFALLSAGGHGRLNILQVRTTPTGKAVPLASMVPTGAAKLAGLEGAM